MKEPVPTSESGLLTPEAIHEKTHVAGVSVLWAIVLTASKLVVGLLTNSIGIISEALHSGLDLVAAGITYFAVSTSGKPADREHTYGHGKVEALSAFIEVLILLITCAWIIYEAVERIANPSVKVEVNVWSFVVMIASIAINLHRTIALQRVARKYGSQALAADALHFAADIASSVVVIVGLVFTYFSFHLADPIAAIAVSGVIFWASLDLGRKTVNVLMDRAPEQIIQQVEEALQQTPDIQEPHRIRVREQGDRVFVDVIISVDRNLSFERSHHITASLEGAIYRRIPNADIVIHAEPVPLPTEDIAHRVRMLGLSTPGITDVHNIQVKDMGNGLLVDFHVGFMPGTPFLKADQLSNMLGLAIREEIPIITELSIHMEPVRPLTIGMEVSERYPDLVQRIREFPFTSAAVIRQIERISLVKSEDEISLLLHCRLDRDLTLSQAHEVTSAMEREAIAAFAELRHVIIQARPI